MAGNANLRKANGAKNDEYYTQLSDIEKELRHYRKHFKDKIVFCNCDDPFESNFFKYFVLNFNRLGLKKLICTCYTNSPIANTQLSFFDVVDNAQEDKPYKAVVTTVYDKTGDGGVDMLDVAELFKSGENTLTELQGNGDFRSEECIELLKESDIVVTNPPFSLFREYIAKLMEYNKKFIVIGNKNSITYKEIFPLLKDNKLWIGSRSINKDFWLLVPNGYKFEKIDEYGNHIKHIMACWFTNLDIKKRHEDLILVKRYNPEYNPKYDNYNAINIDKVDEIPCDYYPCWFYCDKSEKCDWANEKGLNESAVALCENNNISLLDNASPDNITVFNENKYSIKKCNGLMGVPITFMDKYNPEQFEIIGFFNNYKPDTADSSIGQIYGEAVSVTSTTSLFRGPVVNGKAKYFRILIRNKHPEE